MIRRTCLQRKEHSRHRMRSKILEETSSGQMAQWPLSCLVLEVACWINLVFRILMALSSLVISLCSALGLAPRRLAPKLQIQGHFLAKSFCIDAHFCRSRSTAHHKLSLPACTPDLKNSKYNIQVQTLLWAVVPYFPQIKWDWIHRQEDWIQICH